MTVTPRLVTAFQHPARRALKATFDLRPSYRRTVHYPSILRARIILACLLLAAASRPTAASGHGPVFGGAPPTLGKGGWQLDQAWMGRLGHGSNDDERMLRTTPRPQALPIRLPGHAPHHPGTTILAVRSPTASTKNRKSGFG